THTVKAIGSEPNVKLDRIIFTTDASCVPTGTGDNCLVTSDTTKPSAPTNLTATAASSSQINLSWTASTDNVGVTGYYVYRGATQVGNPSSTTFNDTGLSASTSYSYTIKAYDAA